MNLLVINDITNKYKMENIPKAIKEFNEFKYKEEGIFTKSKWTGDWEDDKAILLICAEYICEDDEELEKCHINYFHKYWGSKRFNEWLNKYNFYYEWDNYCTLHIYLNKN